ncbi:MAG TPA: hypothetical protein VM367_02010 [Pseudonocardia sp.]|nr:hypothetical protein [Pseudonocardia sp.]
MAVSLPTAADVRRAREQAVKGVAERAEVARTPLLAVLGAGDYAVATVTKAVEQARARAAAQREAARQRVAELPTRLTADELRAQAESTYTGFAERGERAWSRIRRQPQVQQVVEAVETYTGKLDARVEDLVDDAHDAAERALATVSVQTRTAGDRVSRVTQRFTRRAAGQVTEAAAGVATAGGELAEDIRETGDEVARETRRTARVAAEHTAPEADHAAPLKPGPTPKTAPKPAPKAASAPKTAPPKPARKPAAGSDGASDG